MSFLSAALPLHQSICEHMAQPHSALFIRPYGHGTVSAQGKGGRRMSGNGARACASRVSAY